MITYFIRRFNCIRFELCALLVQNGINKGVFPNGIAVCVGIKIHVLAQMSFTRKTKFFQQMPRIDVVCVQRYKFVFVLIDHGYSFENARLQNVQAIFDSTVIYRKGRTQVERRKVRRRQFVG